ncbi:MAG: hypothetical protein HKL80_10705 [Acidimicrobiales bacterium]|nr:hypothetical protein [Acidimicrobiales bacterium]
MGWAKAVIAYGSYTQYFPLGSLQFTGSPVASAEIDANWREFKDVSCGLTGGVAGMM